MNRPIYDTRVWDLEGNCLNVTELSQKIELIDLKLERPSNTPLEGLILSWDLTTNTPKWVDNSVAPVVYVEVTYEELIGLINNEELIPGTTYRLTNFTTKIDPNYDDGEYRSAEIPFDILLVANSTSTFLRFSKITLNAEDDSLNDVPLDEFLVEYNPTDGYFHGAIKRMIWENEEHNIHINYGEDFINMQYAVYGWSAPDLQGMFPKLRMGGFLGLDYSEYFEIDDGSLEFVSVFNTLDSETGDYLNIIYNYTYLDFYTVLIQDAWNNVFFNTFDRPRCLVEALSASQNVFANCESVKSSGTINSSTFGIDAIGYFPTRITLEGLVYDFSYSDCYGNTTTVFKSKNNFGSGAGLDIGNVLICKESVGLTIYGGLRDTKLTYSGGGMDSVGLVLDSVTYLDGLRDVTYWPHAGEEPYSLTLAGSFGHLDDETGELVYDEITGPTEEVAFPMIVQKDTNGVILYINVADLAAFVNNLETEEWVFEDEDGNTITKQVVCLKDGN